MRIGPYELSSQAVLAPMAGVTDRPFRVIARSFGAGLAASEMITSDVRLWTTKKTQSRMNHEGEPEPRVVQLAGADPEALAEAARRNIDLGAQIIDINMGCPAKKVCNRLCGSALLTDEALVAKILERVVAAVERAGHAENTHRASVAMRATACASRNSLNRVASQRSPCTAARAKISMTEKPSTTRFEKSHHASKFRYSQMVISTLRKKRAQCLISPAQQE